ncbi:MAG TPA: aryl-sulfate sulfotransferase [Bacteroidales bacterium]|nr:aryl-sulfate sulfotransferase [Bacteroidales bacterium]HSA43712.1 aryl-sulfate sulfotransferase [Bacteroidales bacterium]
MKQKLKLNPAVLIILLGMSVSLAYSQGAPWGDYTLYSTMSSTKAYLINMSGATYHSWTFASTARTGYSSYLLPGGTLVRTVSNQGNVLFGGGMTGRVQKVDWNGTVLWDFTHSSSTYCLHHDIHPMPNGNVLMISYEVKTAAQAVQAGSAQNITVWSEKIMEVQPTGATTGTVVWEWKLWDHLCQNHNSAKDNYVTSILDHPELMNINYSLKKDWVHMNGIDYNPELDQIVVSSHYLNEYWVIDHSTTTAEAAGHSGGNSGKGGDILYRWGNPTAYGASGTTIFNVMHDAHWIQTGLPHAGSLVAFNNKGGSGNKSCIDRIYPPYDGYNYLHTAGQAYAPSTYEWRHTYTGNATQDMGNSQQLPNGNVLICIAGSGYIYEIDSNNIVVWSKSVSGTPAQAFRYTAAYVAGYSVTATASPAVICDGDSSQLSAAVTGGTNVVYTWTSDPAGFASTLQNPWVYPATTTVYTVKAVSGSDSATASVTVTVNPLPATPLITQSGGDLISSQAATYQWYLAGQPINGATAQLYTPLQNGLYQVQTGNSNACLSQLSDPFNFTGVGINDDDAEPALIIFPNPARNTLYLRGRLTREKDFEVGLLDGLGRLVFHGLNMNAISLDGLKPGFYLLRLRSSDGNFSFSKIQVYR